MTAGQRAASTAFWQWLAARTDRLPGLRDHDAAFFDELLAQLQRIDTGLWLEVGGNPEPCEIVLTADGDPERFDLVEAIAALAPAIPGWRVVALKPALGFAFVITWEGVRLDPKQLWFQSVPDLSTPHRVGLRLAAPGHTAALDQRYHLGILKLLDSALGERAAVRDVHVAEVVALPDDPDAAGFLPLVDLGKFIEWRRARPAP